MYIVRTVPKTQMTVWAITVVVIILYGKADIQNVCFASLSLLYIITTVPFAALLHSQTQHVTSPLQEIMRVIISAWKSSRAGTPAWTSSDISHRNTGFFILSVVCVCFLVSRLLRKGCVRKWSNSCGPHAQCQWRETNLTPFCNNWLHWQQIKFIMRTKWGSIVVVSLKPPPT